MALVEPLPPKPPPPPDVPTACVKKPNEDDVYCPRLYRPASEFIFTDPAAARRYYAPGMSKAIQACADCLGRVPKELR